MLSWEDCFRQKLGNFNFQPVKLQLHSKSSPLTSHMGAGLFHNTQLTAVQTGTKFWDEEENAGRKAQQKNSPLTVAAELLCELPVALVRGHVS